MTDLYDIQLDPATWDLKLNKKASGYYDIALISGADRILQAIRIRLRVWYGEWFLDTTIGIPYLEKILIKNPSLPSIENLLRAQILSVDGVLSVPSLQATYNTKSRTLSVTFVAVTTDKQLSAIEDLTQVTSNGN